MKRFLLFWIAVIALLITVMPSCDFGSLIGGGGLAPQGHFNVDHEEYLIVRGYQENKKTIHLATELFAHNAKRGDRIEFNLVGEGVGAIMQMYPISHKEEDTVRAVGRITLDFSLYPGNKVTHDIVDGQLMIHYDDYDGSMICNFYGTLSDGRVIDGLYNGRMIIMN